MVKSYLNIQCMKHVPAETGIISLSGYHPVCSTQNNISPLTATDNSFYHICIIYTYKLNTCIS